MDNKGTIGEKFVNELAYNSFLKFWCYPGPKYENGDKKEICDLLIIFDDTAIIFSVKNYEFKGNYPRYFKKTIKKALNQIHGAYRILFDTAKVIIKHPDKDSEQFPREQINKIFRIIVNLGEGAKFYPFNGITKNNNYVTFFDKASFETIISELDTIADFTEYLEKREKSFKDKNTIILPGIGFDFNDDTKKQLFKMEVDPCNPTILISGSEKDLLSIYFAGGHNFPKSLDRNEELTNLVIDGAWEKFAGTQRKKNKYNADKVSYFIDNLVRDEILKNNMLKILPSTELDLAKSLLSFNRLKRRSITSSYYSFYNKFKGYKGSKLPSHFIDIDRVGILFTYCADHMDLITQQAQNEYAIRSCYLRAKFNLKSMILISTNSRNEIKLVQIDKLEIFSSDQEKKLMKSIEAHRPHTKQTLIHKLENEFPE